MHLWFQKLTQRFFRASVDTAETENAKTGIWGENVAAEFLEQHGYRVVARRVRVRRDEIDIIATHKTKRGTELVFVEVKTRASDSYGGGLAALNTRKRHALCRAAAQYLRKHPPVPFRFDLIEVVGTRASETLPRVRHHQHVFSTATNTAPRAKR